MTKTPHAAMKASFESKEKLVEAVQKLATKELWLDRVSEVKGLARVSNAKLLRLHAVLTRVKKEFGTREKLIEAIASLEKRSKDAGFKTRLEGYPLPRLVDLFDASSKRQKRAAARAKAAPAKKTTKKSAKKTSAATA